MVETDSQAAIELIQDKEKGQGISGQGNVPPTNRKKVSPRKHLGSFSLACDRARRSTAESQKGKTYMAPTQSELKKERKDKYKQLHHESRKSCFLRYLHT